MFLFALMMMGISITSSFAQLTTYNQSFTSVTGVNIAGTTHNLGCSAFTVTVRTPSGTKISTSGYTYTIDPATYDLAVSFGGTYTGEIYLQGCFSPTGASTDFQPVASSAGVLTICGSCTTSAYADRKYVNSDSYIIWIAGTQSWTLDALNNGTPGTAYIYADSITLHLMVALTTAGDAVYLEGGNGSDYIYNATGYPASAVPIATVTFDGAGNFGTVTDTRAFQN